MIRDLSNINRTLDDLNNNDIIYKKAKLMDAFKSDPDLNEVLGKKDKLPLNKYADVENPTEEELKERQRILAYNKEVSKPQILDYLKVNDIQTQVLNFVMFDISDANVSYDNAFTKNQRVTVMCLVHEDDMESEYGINRVDLLSYIVKDILCWSNLLGLKMKLYSDIPEITDTKYYARTLTFVIQAPNTNNFRNGNMINSYEHRC